MVTRPSSGWRGCGAYRTPSPIYRAPRGKPRLGAGDLHEVTAFFADLSGFPRCRARWARAN